MTLPLPLDLELLEVLAISFILLCWFFYSTILNLISQGSLNQQLSTVRAQWLMTSISRGQKPFDAILLGHIVNSVAFFGSATLLVLAGVVTLFTGSKTVYGFVSELNFAAPQSFELFVLHIGVLNFVLATSFFSFTYALRKLIYVLALIGALPEQKLDAEADALRQSMVTDAATVLSEALKTFNFGIRGYYYFVAAICLFISPYLSVFVTVVVTGILMYRQIGTSTALAIKNYVAASNQLHTQTPKARDE